MMPTASQNWKKNIFGDQPSVRLETRIRAQVEGIERLLELKHRARVLDLGCGGGAQTLELARRGYRVMGMDVSAKSLADARDRARDEKLTVHFLSQDMRRLPYRDEFNAVINIRNPIGCYPREADDQDCMDAAGRSLKPGGKLLLDLLNREWLMRRLPANTRADLKEPSFDINTGRVDCSVFSSRGGRADSSEQSLRLYSLTEVLRMLRDADLTFRKVYGGYDGRPYGVETLRMIVVAEKVRKRPPETRKPHDEYERALRIKGRPR